MPPILVQPLSREPILVSPILAGAPNVIALEGIPGPPGAALSTIALTIDAGVMAIGPGIKDDVPVEYAHSLTGWRIVADQAGDIKVDISMTSYANFPAGFVSIGTAQIIGASKAEGDMTGWLPDIPAGSILRYTVISANLIRRATVSLAVERG